MSNKYFCCSDIHSYYSILHNELLSKGWNDNNNEHILILCGDAFDRGEEAVEMFEFMKNLQDQNRLIYIKGNHEELLFDCVAELKENNGCVSIHHYQNGTVNTISQFKKSNILENVLEFIDKYAIDYFELGSYIFCHGWVPIVWKCNHSSDGELSAMLSPELVPTSDKIAWKKARWLNGMTEWHRGNKLDNKTIVCGHWHVTESNMKFHNSGSGKFDKYGDFLPFIDEGIIALDACTSYSKKINILVIDENEKILKV